MKRFKQLISVIAAAAVMLGCLCVSAAAESPAGSLTVTIQGNNQGVSTAGITLNLYRIGGDEFTVVLKDTEYECREAKLTELEQRIRANNEQAQEEYMRISVAWGLAEYEKDQDRSFEEVYRKADRSMYQMKQRMHE